MHKKGEFMDWNFILIALGITIAWVGLIIFYMRVVSRQKFLMQELKELDEMMGLNLDDEDHNA